VNVRRNAFSTFSSERNEGESKVKQKVESWNANFHKWKEIWIYKRCLYRFPFQRRAPMKKTIVVSCDYFHPLCVVRVKKEGEGGGQTIFKKPWKKIRRRRRKITNG
jgi:hypothetical protein